MSLKSPFAWIAALVVVISVTSVARAQTMPVSHASHVGVDPFIELDRFSPDFQFFAPAQVDPYSGGEPPNVGYYGTYDRLYINVNRPEGEPSPSVYGGDFTWGNRFDLGYMTPERTGWGVSVWHIGGPNQYFTVAQERIDRHNDSDPSDGLGGGGNTGGGGGNNNNTVILPQDRNPRIYDLSQSLNVAHFTSFELNRIFRKQELHYGGVFEPFIGARYIQFVDFGRRDNYNRFAADTTTNQDPDFSTPTTAGPWEIYDTLRTQFQNNMLGGQVGFRYSKQTGHWMLSTEFRAFALQNWQYFNARNTQISTLYNANAGGGGGNNTSNIIRELHTATLFTSNGSELVWGGEVRAEAAYELSRDVNIRGGFVMLDLGKGVGRGLNTSTNTQDVHMIGWTLGFTVNR